MPRLVRAVTRPLPTSRRSNDFTVALDAAGAAAVVGTECTVFSGLASEFADRLTAALRQGTATLGEVIQQIRGDLMQSGNPLAFVFTCVGESDLSLQLGGDA